LPGFAIDDVIPTENILHIRAHSLKTMDYCPDCQESSRSIHSRYTRHPQDLPCTQHGVRLELCVHRFRCANPTCPRRTFVERLPELVPFYARRTQRLTARLRAVAFEAGARISRHFGIQTSGDTLLRVLRQTPETSHLPPRVVGLDDWAFKKGLRYGTILVDLERHRPIDLLPDRQVETVKQWLAQHPGVEIVTRDRSQDYAQAITQGAPQAVQIADRWHLLKNLTDALQKVLNGYARRLRRCGVDPQTTLLIQVDDVPERSPSQRERHQSQMRRAARLERHQQVHQLHEQGWQQKTIAHHLDISARTVSRYLAAATFPEHRRRRASRLDRYKTYLLQRWNEGCHNATRLADEIRSQGYVGGITQVREYVARLRQAQAAQIGQSSPSLPTSLASKPLTPRRAAFLLLCPLDEKNGTLADFRQQFFNLFPELQTVAELFQAFSAMVREKRVADFDDWLRAAKHSDCTALKQFVRGLQRDEAAVRAALSSDWSNGQCEGQINRLKFLKRQMYGRAKFDLLRLRVLHPT
jgi:transposase